MAVDAPRALPAPASAAGRRRPGRWWRSVVVVALLLSASGWLNVSLNAASARSTVAAASLLRLDAALHQEGTLQWRALAERGTPTRVAADVGYARAAEAELVAQLGELLPEGEVDDLQGQIDDYHVALDEELSLLAVGRTDDALRYEREVTAPRFEALNRWLQDRAGGESADAARLARLAHVLLAVTLAAVALVIGLLVWRTDRAHRASEAIGEQLLEAERTTVERLRASEAAVRHQADHDPLTGLPNRSMFNRSLTAAVASSATAVLFVDLDGFKAVNDAWGHAVGDQLLIEVGARLRRCARAEDVVARLGGDEFALLLVDADTTVASAVVQRLETAMRDAVTIGEVQVAVGASVGVAFGAVGADPDQLLTEADHRMYERKRGVRTG